MDLKWKDSHEISWEMLGKCPPLQNDYINVCFGGIFFFKFHRLILETRAVSFHLFFCHLAFILQKNKRKDLKDDLEFW